MEFKEAKPVKLLHAGETISVTVQDSLFFKYMLKETANLENHVLLLQVSQKEDLQVFIGKTRYPSAELKDHTYAIGDVPQNVWKNCLRCGMIEIYQNPNIFDIDKDTGNVMYTASYKHCNPDLFKENQIDKFDSERVQKLSTWTASCKEPKASLLTPVHPVE